MKVHYRKEVALDEGEKEFKEWNLEFAPDIRQPDIVVKDLQKEVK